MSKLSSVLSSLAVGPSALPWRALALMALMAGICLAFATTTPHSRALPPVWGQAQWISPAGTQPVAYYRAEIFLPALPRQAFLQIAAPDSVEVHVNGKKAGESRATSVNTMSYLDVAGLLRPGRNVLAIRVARKTWPGTASLRARLVWRDDAGHQGELGSRPGWLTQSHEERQRDGQLGWQDSDFQDSHWARARTFATTDSVLPAYPWLDARLFDRFPRGSWISSSAVRLAGASFQRDFEIQEDTIETAWLGVASRMPYSITINQVRTPAQPASSLMTVIDIAPFLHPGSNRIQIETSNNGTGEGIAVAGVVLGPDNTETDFSSDSRWQSRDDQGQSQPVHVLAGIGGMRLDSTQPARAPQLQFLDVSKPGVLWLRPLAMSLLYALVTFLLVAGALLLTRHGLPPHLDARLASSLRPLLLLGSLMLAGGLLVAQDVRLWSFALLSVHFVLLVLLAVLALGVLAILEVRHAQH